MTSLIYCLVGCNTGSPEKDALHVLEMDAESGAARIVQTVKGRFEGTTYFQFDWNGTTLYSMIGEKRNAKSIGMLVSFPVKDHRIGEMKRLTDLPCEAPCHLALSPDRRLISTAAYCGKTACIYDLATSNLISVVLTDKDVGPREDRQKQAYAHQTFYTPDGRMIGVVDLGCDRIHFYDLKFKKLFELTSDAGDGPRHAIFSADGKRLFVVNELSSTVTSYRYDGERTFTKVSKLRMTPEGTDEKTTKAAAIKLTKDGKMLMASNRGLDSIAFYDVEEDGTLRFRTRAPLTGKFPRDFELTPDEKYMVVGHKMSNEIQVYRFDRGICALTPVGKPIACWRPLCFKFF